MTTYVLCKSSAIQAAPGTVQGGPPGSNLPSGSQLAFPGGGANQAGTPPTNQTFHVLVTGTGSVSATVQVVVSNDGVNWINFGAAIAVTAGTSPVQNSATGAANWAYYSAFVTAITGTSAVATCTMNA